MRLDSRQQVGPRRSPRPAAAAVPQGDVPDGPKPERPAERPRRVLMASHSHPAFTHGGAEIAAYHLFEQLQQRPDFEAWFLGAHNAATDRRLGAAITQPFSPREFVYASSNFEWFKYANRDPLFATEFPALLQHIQPDVVHFHHFVIFGVEAFQQVRRVLPQAKIVLTFHEYLAICHNHGQMITTRHESLCYESSQRACANCYPQISQADFFLRRLYILRCLDWVDSFIAPSRFLADRMIAWGLPAARVSVIDNLILPAAVAPTLPAVDEQAPFQVGFFGQVSRLKGINVVLDCARQLHQKGITDIIFDIYGDYRGQPVPFQNEFLERLKDITPNVTYHGPYEPQRLDRLMQGVDVVLVPSVWWENSPLVIQEAFRNRRPVICSDIGGMAEKVRDGLDGWHIPAGKPASMMALLMQLAGNRKAVREMAETMQGAPGLADVCEAHVRAYAEGGVEVQEGSASF